MTITETALAPKTRVIAATPLPGVPKGTAGRVGRAVGLSLIRYRVAFDNGVDLTSVTHTDLVKEDEWDEYEEQQEAEAAAADAGGAPSTGADAADDEGAASPADDRLAALLAKSKAAKAKKLGDDSAAEPEPEPPPAPAAEAEGEEAASPADDRLAALLAKSKAAKAKKLGEG